MIPPTGRLKAKKRPFHEIVYDMRHLVFSIIRKRPAPQQLGMFQASALGTGFFVAPKIFITCNHVINGDAPHQVGDSYLLVANLNGTSGTAYELSNPQLNTEINLFPSLDLAVIRIDNAQANQPYACLAYNEVYEGEEIGVVGYPIPELRLINGALALNSLVFRASRGHVTGRYTANFDTTVVNAPVVEVNFLFVNGNSGGPVLNSETGRVLGFVRGYRSVKIRERVENASMITQMPIGLPTQYIENLNAIYSLALKLDFVRATIEGFGATL